MAQPSPAPPFPTEELLTTDPNPNPGPSSTPPNSASSSSTAATPLPDKRTREQPNLSDCHCCCRRINHTNPKDRLQPLDSVWRIVLLCRKCRNKVSSGQTCPYCFELTGNSGDLVECCVCKSIIHEDCVRDYGNCTPWCYMGVGLGEFSICVDCWVPDLLKNSIRDCVGSDSKGVAREDNGDDKDGLDKLMKNRKFVVEKKVKMASKAKGQELRKAMAAKKALDMANSTSSDLESSAKKGCDGRKGESSNSTNAIEIIDDAELAIQFRRVFNSFPRISRREFFLNPSDVSVWKIMNWSGISYKRSRLGRECGKGQKMHSSSLENDIIEWAKENGSSSNDDEFKLRLSTYKRDKKRKIWKIDDANVMVFESRSIQPEEKFELHSNDARTTCSTDVSDALLCVNANKSGSPPDVDRYISEALIGVKLNADQTSSCIGVDRFGQKLAIYRRNRFRKKGQVNGMVYVSGEYHFCDNCEFTCKTEHGQHDILPNGSCDKEQDRYYLKYFKRVSTTKSYLSRVHSNTVRCENKSLEIALSNSESDSSLKCDGELRLLNESSDAGQDRYSFKYVKKVKASKSGSSDGESRLLNESSDAALDRYSFKYVKRVKASKSGSNAVIKLCSDSIQPQSEASATGLIVHHTAESRTMSTFI